MRLWAHHAVGHGADVVSYFRWRRCRQGQEQYHAGLRKADGSPDRGYADARRAADEFADLPAADGVDAPIALLHDYDDCWAIGIEPHAPDFDYWEHLGAYYRALRARGVTVDVVHPRSDLSGYSAAVAPTLHLADADLATHLKAYVDAGGHLLLGVRSGYKDPFHKLHDEPAPGPLAALVGATVDRHESLPETMETTVAYDGSEYAYRTWAEWLAPEVATGRGEHASGLADRACAIVERDVVDGSVAYYGVWPGKGLADALVVDLLERAGVEAVDRLPDGVRLAERGERT